MKKTIIIIIIVINYFFSKKNIKRKDIKNNPIYNITLHFLNKFINGINGRSYLFLPLLMLYNGIYFNNKEK